MSKLFESNWDSFRDELLGDLSGHRREVTQIALENALKSTSANMGSMLNEAAQAGSTAAGSIASINKIIMPVIRRVMPGVIANELVGVQPMTGPFGQINSLRFKYAETIPTAGGGVTAGTEALSPFFTARYYSGDQNVANGEAAPTADLEGTGGPALDMEIVRTQVQAKSRKLRASWTFEAAQDAQSQHGIDVEAEMMAVLAQQVTVDIDQELLNHLRNLVGGPVVTYDQANVSGVATYVGDQHAALAILISQQADQIARKTRRGPANWAVVPPSVVTLLRSGATSTFARTTDFGNEGISAPTNTKYVGMLNDSMKIFVDNYATTSRGILIGYRGNETTDAGTFYCPYVPISASGIVMNPNTFQPTVSFMTRYAIESLNNPATSLGNASDYLSIVGVKESALAFQ